MRVLVLLAILACSHPPPPPPPIAPAPIENVAPPVEVVPAAPAADEDLDSKDILAREPPAATAQVKHVLIGWAALADNYHGHLDPRAAHRSNAEAATLARDILAKLRADPAQITALEKDISEDPGSAADEAYDVTTGSQFVPEFKALSLRLREGEVGIVRTVFGYHVILRVPPAPRDPLESAAILARPAEAGPVSVQHVLISWAGKGRTTQTRSKADADALVVQTLARLKRGEKMPALMKELSEDPGSKDDAKPYEVTTDAPMVQPFKDLSLRLRIGEVGVVQTVFGWHVIKRIAPPPPDRLASVAILARTKVASAAKVKHILLGWTERHADDPRGVARSRADLEKLVKSTLAKLKQGAAIEDLMKELSEDPGSAADGKAYDVTPDAGLVKPFLNLSLRLNVGEVGVVDTIFGIHIIKRVE